MALIPPAFLDCVVAVGRETGEDDATWVASGFFYGLRAGEVEPAQYRVYLVTNRHVIAGLDDHILVRANPRAQEEQTEDFRADLATDDGTPLWHGHPDPEIDVAVVAVNFQHLLEREMQVLWFQSDAHASRTDELTALGITEGDGVFICGYPMGLVGRDRAFAIVRSGSVARIRDTLAGTDSTFLVDATVFPGNSGGPVILRPEVVAIQGTEATSKSTLLGVVSSYVPYVDVAVSPQTGNPRITFEENSGLSAAYPVDFIDETIIDWHGVPGVPEQPMEGAETAAETPPEAE